MSPVVRWTEDTLRYRFQDKQLLRQALKHRSAGGTHNERLEYLGDAVLSLVVAEALYERLPDADEGYLSRLRASLVRRETLSDVASDLNLGERIELGPGEMKSGGHRRASILADSLEALYGAIYLDSGLDAAREVITRSYGARLQDLPARDALKDPKTRLQELLQGRGLALPVYVIDKVEGEDHQRRFTASCAITALDLKTTGTGSSRRGAEQHAAERMMTRLGNERA